MNRNRRIVISTALAGTVVIGGSAVAAAAASVSAAAAATHSDHINTPAPTQSSAEAAALELALRGLNAQAHGLNEKLTAARAKVEEDRLAILNSQSQAQTVRVALLSSAPTNTATTAAPQNVSHVNPVPLASGKVIQAKRTPKPTAPPTHITTGASGSTVTLGDDGNSSDSGGDQGNGSDQSSNHD